MRLRLLFIGVVIVVLVGTTVTASAHISVEPSSAPRGSVSKVTFRVPNERPASTTKIELQLPPDQPFTSVTVLPLPGWTYSLERTTLAAPMKTERGDVTDIVSKITWSGGTIKTGEFQEFTISGGPLPSSGDHVVFKALQTYDTGEVVRWIEETKQGQPEPQFPAPELALGEAVDEHGAVPPTPASKSDARKGLTFGITGIVFGAAALVISGAGLRRQRRSTAR